MGIECKWVKWCELQWCGVNWRDICEVNFFKWSVVSYVEVHRDKITMYVRVNLYSGYLIVLWLFYLVCILYCGCCNLFCNKWVCVCVGVCMCGGVYVWVCICVGVCVCGCFGNKCTCISCVFVFFLLCIFILNRYESKHYCHRVKTQLQ